MMKTAKRAIGGVGGTAIGYFTFTGLFALQMGFTAYAQLRLPEVAAAFTHLGFPGYFRVELAIAKLVGLAVLLAPMAPARLKEWAYAGFTICLGSAMVAHLAVGDGVAQWGWALGTFVLGAGSYAFHRRLGHARAETSGARRDAPLVVA